jgi:hypothetical protein
MLEGWSPGSYRGLELILFSDPESDPYEKSVTSEEFVSAPTVLR